MHQPLVDQRALLDAVLVLDLPRADLEPALAEGVEAADAVDRLVAGPVLELELVEALERRTCGDEPGLDLLALLLGAVVEARPAGGSANGSVRPWPTTVTRIRAKVMNRIRSRPGSGAPASVVSGSARAAASDTAPRIPDQP